MTRASDWRRFPFIPARYFDSLVILAAPERQARARLLAAAGLRPDQLDHPENLLCLEQLEALVRRAREWSGDPELALRLGSELNLSAHGTLGLAGLSSERLGDAVRVAVEHFTLVTPLLRPRYRRGAAHAWLRITPAGEQSGTLHRFLMETLLASLYVQGRFLLEGRIPPVRVRLPFREQLTRYRRLFPELRVEAGDGPGTLLVFPATVMDRPLPLANAAVRERALRQCRAQLQQLPHPQHPVRTVNWLLRESVPPPDAPSVARRLGLSERGLRRRLAAQGCHFRELAQAARLDRAQRLLREGMSVSETAFACGYSDVGNFSRAFRRRFGVTPGRYRAGD